MRRQQRLLSAIVIGLAIGSAAVAGCGALPPATGAPSAGASARPTPTPVPGITLPSAVVIELAAKDLEFDQQAIDVHAGAPFVIHFRNLEPTEIFHNVEIRRSDGANVVWGQDVIPGGADASYEFPALAVGNYLFICKVHPIPAMTGTLLVR